MVDVQCERGIPVGKNTHVNKHDKSGGKVYFETLWKFRQEHVDNDYTYIFVLVSCVILYMVHQHVKRVKWGIDIFPGPHILIDSVLKTWKMYCRSLLMACISANLHD